MSQERTLNQSIVERFLMGFFISGVILASVYLAYRYKSSLYSSLPQNVEKEANSETLNQNSTIEKTAAEFGILTFMRSDLAQKLIDKARANPDLEKALKITKKSYIDILPRTEFGIDYTDYGMDMPALIINVEAPDQEIIDFILKNKEVQAQ